MAKTTLTDEEKAAKKAAAKAAREAPSGLRDQLEKLRLKEAKLLADLAVKEHPDLADAIETLSNFTLEMVKVSKAAKAGGDVSLAREKERMQKQIDYFQNKIDALKVAMEGADSDVILKQLAEAKVTATKNLRDAYETVAPQFEAVGVQVEQLLPTIEPFLAEIKAPAEPAAPTADAAK